MKKIFILFFIVLASVSATGQTACSDKKVITPVVSKPKDGTILSATCTQLMVQWKGAADQTYIVSATYKNANKTATAYASSTSCDNSFNCTATIPVKAGTNVNWSVQAAQVIDERTFYSYVFRGERDYLIPACNQTITKATIRSDIQETVIGKDKLIVFPNPAANEIIIQWNSNYIGAASITINDASGKAVKVLTITKTGAAYTNRISINTLISGIYFLNIKTAGSPPLITKFFKE